MTSPRLFSAACERNQGPILAALQALLPAPGGRLLEIAAGSGQHAAHCAAALPQWQWQPTDPDDTALASIAAWGAGAAAPNLLAPVRLDVLQQPWPVAGPFDAVFNANMLHISPPQTAAALMQGAAERLRPGGLLITYGPYQVQGEPLAPGNQAFDADLRRRNPAWGLRWLHELQAEALHHGLRWQQRLALPANNQILVFERA